MPLCPKDMALNLGAAREQLSSVYTIATLSSEETPLHGSFARSRIETRTTHFDRFISDPVRDPSGAVKLYNRFSPVISASDFQSIPRCMF